MPDCRGRVRNRPIKDITGQVFGTLEAVRFSRREPKATFWIFKCLLCGEEHEISISVVLNGHRRWCPCVQWEYDKWNWARKRTNSDRPKVRSAYRDRGIVMEPEFDDFLVFIAEVGVLPSQKHELDRISVDGNYGPGNVRWLTRDDPDGDRQRNIYVEFDGESHHLTEWARIKGHPPYRILRRWNAGIKTPNELFAPPKPMVSEFGLIEYDRRSLTAKQWTPLCGFSSHDVILDRLRSGRYTVEQALTIPSAKNPNSGYKHR